ncbi:MAG: PKD domain-containing protein [Chitinophagaceae bacterium]|nr:MAG: PKD domain-containing protein [Chitinophagaceae bacterium]
MRKFKLLFLALTFMSFLSCGDDDTRSVVDCFGESLLMSVDHEKAAANPKQVTFEAKYFGDHDLDGTIKWNFADGTPVQTLSGTTATHTYTTSGTYHAAATVSLNGGGCSYDLKETVTID